MGSYWSNSLTLSPLFLWKIIEASGTVFADAAGGDDNADLLQGPMPLAQMSLIPNEPTDLAAYFPGGTAGFNHAYLRGGSAGNATTDLTILMWIRPDHIGVERWLGSKNGHVQLRIMPNGTLWFYLWPAGAGLFTLLADALVANTTVMLAYRLRAGLQSTWINGVKKAEQAFAGSIDASGSQWVFGHLPGVASAAYRGWAMGVQVHVASSLTDAEILARYTNGMAPPNEAPIVPGVYTSPTAGQVVDDSLVLAWGASTDPEGNPVTYEEEYALDGGAWTSMHGLQSGAGYTWNTSALPAASVQARVRAYDATGGGYSAWRTSDVFTIAHVSAGPVATPSILSRSDKSITVKVVVTDPDVGLEGTHAATQYQVDTEADNFAGAPKIDTGWLSDHRKTLHELTAMPSNTAFLLRVRGKDGGGQEGAWTVLPFRTRRIFALGVAAGFEQERNEGTHADAATITATYGTLIFGTGFNPVLPDLAAGEFGQPREGRGYNIGWVPSASDYVQPSGTGTLVYTRYGGANLNPTEAGNSFMLIFRPRVVDPAGKNLLFGSEEWWIYRHGTTIFARSGSMPGTGGPGTESFHSISGLQLNQTNILLGAYLYEYRLNGDLITPGIFSLWLNGVRTSIGALSSDPVAAWPTATNASADNQTRDMEFDLGAVPHNYLYLGSQSSDGARSPGDSNYNGFTGRPNEFAWWSDYVLSNANAAAIYTAYQNADADVLAPVVKSLNPILYDRFRQPMQPSKPILEAGVA